MKKADKIPILNSYLDELYANPRCELYYETAFQLLIATILSAQCTDKQVNKVTPKLFERYRCPESMAKADIAELETLIHSTGFYKNKAKNIKNASTDIVEKYGGVLPSSLEELVKLSGVGRKTANVVLGNAFNIAGVVVDTHMLRVTKRLKLTSSENPVQVEQDIMKILQKDRWTRFSHQVVLFGRYNCMARNPKCDSCKLKEVICSYKRG